MTQDNGPEPTVYEYEAPTDRTLSGETQEQDWRDQLFAMTAGIIIAATGVGVYGIVHPLTAGFFGIAGLFFGVGFERYQIMRPDGGLLGQLRGGRE